MRPTSPRTSPGVLTRLTAALLLSASAGVGPHCAATVASARTVGAARTAQTSSQTCVAKADSASAAATTLTQEETVRKEIRGGEPHSVCVKLAAGEYAQIIFQWQGIDLEASVFKPDGSRLGDSTAQVRAQGETSVSVVADVAGDYRLEVRPRERMRINGSYAVRLEAVRQPTSADEARVLAERALTEGRRLQSKAAEEKLSQSLQLWRSIGDKAGEAAALHAMAEMYRLAGDLPGAAKNYEAALALRREMKDLSGEAHTLLDYGGAHQRISSPEAALEYFQKARVLFRAAGDRTGESMSLYNTGFALAQAGRTREAVKSYEEALAIQRADGDRLREVRTLNALGGAYDRLGDYDSALTLYQKAAPIRLELGDRLGEAVTVNNIGVLHDNWGDWQKAKDSYEAALSSYTSLIGDDLKICRAEQKPEPARRICGYAAAALDNLGELYNSLGDPQAALLKFDESLPIRDSINEPRGKGSTRSRMCYSTLLQGDAQAALKLCDDALKIQQPPPAVEGGKSIDPPGLAYTYGITGMVHDALGEREKALDFYRRALELHEASGDLRAQAITLDKAGDSYARAGDVKGALERFDRALKLWQRIREQDGEAITLYKLARAERDRNNLPEAHARITRALDLVESLRANVTSQRLRAAYFATKLDCYELAVELKMQLAKAGGLGVARPDELVASALQANESARARVLLDILGDARVEPLASPDRGLAELLRRRQELQERLNHKATFQTRLLSGKSVNREDASAVEKEIARLAAEYDDVAARLRARSPRRAELIRPRPISLAEIQQLLDEQTLLLEYAIGAERSYLWVVSRSAVKSYELPARGVVEPVAGRVADILRAGQRLPDETGRSYQARLAQLGTQLGEQSELLSRLLLGPAAAELGRKRLLIVAGGELQQVPFAALPVPGATMNVSDDRTRAGQRKVSLSVADDPPPMAAEHEIINLPSASTLAALRLETSRRPRPPKAVAVIADPVFDVDDARLQVASRGGSQAARPKSPPSLKDTVRSFGIKLPRLLFSRREAEGIVAAAPADMATAALDLDANRSTATGPWLSQYRIVHLATHGVFNDQQPELSGVVLSLFDKRGRPREDGFLRLHDIYNLNLPVEMVVLSACQTGLGKPVRGEGMIGLTRGFMYAGASRVVASLWKVDDEATAELMKVFYQRMLKDGMSPPAALREAQLSVRAQKRWHAPYYWAGFVLQGEWK